MTSKEAKTLETEGLNCQPKVKNSEETDAKQAARDRAVKQKVGSRSAVRRMWLERKGEKNNGREFVTLAVVGYPEAHSLA